MISTEACWTLHHIWCKLEPYCLPHVPHFTTFTMTCSFHYHPCGNTVHPRLLRKGWGFVSFSLFKKKTFFSLIPVEIHYTVLLLSPFLRSNNLYLIISYSANSSPLWKIFSLLIYTAPYTSTNVQSMSCAPLTHVKELLPEGLHPALCVLSTVRH